MNFKSFCGDVDPQDPLVREEPVSGLLQPLTEIFTMLFAACLRNLQTRRVLVFIQIVVQGCQKDPERPQHRALH